MANPNEPLSYAQDPSGRSVPLQATEAFEIELPSLLHPIERIRQIQAYAGEFVTHGALTETSRVYTRARLAHFATINAWDMSTHNFNYSAAKFNEAARTFGNL